MKKHPTLAEELAWYRQHLDLRDYLLSKGYEPDRKRATARYPAFTHPLTRDKVFLLKDKRYPVVGYYVNQHDPLDRGTLIDFIRTREQKSLPEIRQALSQFVPGSKLSYSTEETSAAASRHQYVIAKILQEQKQIHRNQYLVKERLIPAEMINGPLFKGQVLLNDYKEDRFLAFPFRDEGREVIGIALKSKDANRMLGSRSGFWYSNPPTDQTKLKNIIITENPIDAMSYHLLLDGRKRQPHSMYVASGGNPSVQQQKVLSQLIKAYEPAEIVLANDNDPAGQQFNKVYRKWLKDSKLTIREDRPQFKDWNADLHALQLLPSKQGWPSSSKGPKILEDKLLPKDLDHELWKKNYPALLSYDAIHEAVVVKKLKGNSYAFSLYEVARINKDRKLKAILEQADRKEEIHTSPTHFSIEEKLYMVKDPSPVSSFDSRADRLKISTSPPLSVDLKNEIPSIASIDDDQTKQNFEHSISTLRELIKDDPAYQQLLRKLDYYQQFPHLSEQQIETYMNIEDRMQQRSPSHEIKLGNGEELSSS